MPEIILKNINMGNSNSSENNQNTLQGIDLFIHNLNLLEGYKTRLKNLHWSAANDMIHQRIDQMLSATNDFQDSIAEEAMGIHNQFGPAMINGIQCLITDPISLLEDIKSKMNIFYKAICGNELYCGIESEIELFFHEINKHIYLFRIALKC